MNIPYLVQHLDTVLLQIFAQMFLYLCPLLFKTYMHYRKKNVYFPEIKSSQSQFNLDQAEPTTENVIAV